MNAWRCICRSLLCLLIPLAAPLTASAQHAEQVAVILQPDLPKSFTEEFATQVAIAIQYRWAELNPTSLSPLFYVSAFPPQEIDYPELVFVRLKGSCNVLPQIAYGHVPRPLGSVEFVDGHASHFMTIDCAEIALTIDQQIRPMRPAERSEAMARAISRVFQHEYMHIHLNTAHHNNEGIFAAQLHSSFLVSPEKEESLLSFPPPVVHSGR